jgi:hypothetical protein
LDRSGTQGASEVEWTAEGIVFDDPFSLTPTGLFPIGTTEVTLIATAGPFVDVDVVGVAIRDRTAPTLSCAASWVAQEDDDTPCLRSIAMGANDVCCGDVTVAGWIDLGWTSVEVVDAQVIDLRRNAVPGDGEEEDCARVSNCGGELTIRSTEALLHGTATDRDGNTATCEVDLCDAPVGGFSDAVRRQSENGGGRVEFGESSD